MSSALSILWSPRDYFSRLASSGEVPWILAPAGFIVAGIADPSDGATSMVVSFLDALLFAVIGCYIGSKTLGGRAPFISLLGGVGVALFWPNLFVTPISFLIVAIFESHPFFLPIYLGVHVLFLIWFFELCYQVVKSMNGFGVVRALLVMIWSIGIGIPVYVLLTLFTPSL